MDVLDKDKQEHSNEVLLSHAAVLRLQPKQEFVDEFSPDSTALLALAVRHSHVDCIQVHYLLKPVAHQQTRNTGDVAMDL